jgi:anti-sigma regulatory factor (Ser/Thr protein kinase)
VNALSPALNREYAGEASTLRAARRDVVDFLLECGANGQTVEKASLIASELASNAIQAAPGMPYQVRIRVLDPNSTALSVRNHSGGSAVPTPDKWRPVDDLAIRGRGLAIVDSLSEEVTVEVDGDEVTVTAWFQLIGS